MTRMVEEGDTIHGEWALNILVPESATVVNVLVALEHPMLSGDWSVADDGPDMALRVFFYCNHMQAMKAIVDVLVVQAYATALTRALFTVTPAERPADKVLTIEMEPVEPNG